MTELQETPLPDYDDGDVPELDDDPEGSSFRTDEEIALDAEPDNQNPGFRDTSMDDE